MIIRRERPISRVRSISSHVPLNPGQCSYLARSGTGERREDGRERDVYCNFLCRVDEATAGNYVPLNLRRRRQRLFLTQYLVRGTKSGLARGRNERASGRADNVDGGNGFSHSIRSAQFAPPSRSERTRGGRGCTRGRKTLKRLSACHASSSFFVFSSAGRTHSKASAS